MGNVDFDALTDESISKIPTDLYREGMVYYGKTHRHPNSTFRYTTSSLMDLMSWDATDNIELINVPLLMMPGKRPIRCTCPRKPLRSDGNQGQGTLQDSRSNAYPDLLCTRICGSAVAKLTDFYGKNLK